MRYALQFRIRKFTGIRKIKTHFWNILFIEQFWSRQSMLIILVILFVLLVHTIAIFVSITRDTLKTVTKSYDFADEELAIDVKGYKIRLKAISL
jgi:hypothetical protein